MDTTRFGKSPRTGHARSVEILSTWNTGNIRAEPSRPDPVTGATGLIGSTATRLLRSRDDEAVALSRNRGPPRTARESTSGGPPAVQTPQHRHNTDERQGNR